MSSIQYATFAKTIDELLAALIAVRSMQRLEIPGRPPIVFIPVELREKFEAKFNGANLKNTCRKLGGNLIEGFAKGFNPKNGFRSALGNLCRRVGDNPIIYFAPTSIFYGDISLQMAVSSNAAAMASSDYWPDTQLYGAPAEQIWRNVSEFAKVNADDWFEQSQPMNYWRRYPVASPDLIFAENALAFFSVYEEVSKSMIEANLPNLRGQDVDLVYPTIAATIMRLNGSITKFTTQKFCQQYEDFYQMIMSANDENWKIINNEILAIPQLRRLLKSDPEMKILFYQNSVRNVYDNLDDVERAFTPSRMSLLVERRNVKGKVKKRLRADAKKADEAINTGEKQQKTPEERAAQKAKREAKKAAEQGKT